MKTINIIGASTLAALEGNLVTTLKTIHLLTLSLLLAFTPDLRAAVPAGKTQQLTSPDQVPEGLAKSDWSSIRAAYEAGRHRVSAVETGGHQARNPGQQWRTRFDGRGFLTQPDAGGWQWGLELRSYGFTGNGQAISGQPSVKAEGPRVTYAWDAAVEEWFVNDARGLEHGFTVRERPAASAEAGAPLQFDLAVRGSLAAQVGADGLGVAFRDSTGATVLNYAGLKVWDADGKVLPARFEPLDTRHSSLVTLSVDDRGARYPLTIDPIAQQAYLKASNPGISDYFGCSVAVAGDTVVVGAFGEASNATGVNGNQADDSAYLSGAAYVFVRSAGVWTQQAYLKASNTEAVDQFGYSVAVAGDTVVVGAVYEDSNATGVNGNQADNSASQSGAAYVFVRNAGVWTQQAYLKASNTEENDSFGTSVAVAGDTVVVGAVYESSSASQSGAAYVFVRSAGVWTQQAYLKASNPETSDQFGRSVAVAGDTVVVGADGESSNATGVNGNQADNSASASGAAYVFVRSAGVWTQQAYLKASNTEAGDRFGYSVAVAGDTVVVGALGESSNAIGVNAALTGGSGTQADNSSYLSGAAYVFVRSAGVWTQQAYLKASNTEASNTEVFFDENGDPVAVPGDLFGVSVAVAGDTVVVGAVLEDSNATGVNGNQADNSAIRSGAAYVFVRSAGVWTQQAYLKASNTGAGDWFGYSVAVAGDSVTVAGYTVVVGANLEASNATGVNGNQADNSVVQSGAAYVFVLPPDPVSLINSAIATIAALAPSQFDAPGHQNTLQNWLNQALGFLPGNVLQAKNKLSDAIKRTDGCVLRGTPDLGPVPAADFITDCAAQAIIYAQLTAAYNAL